MSAPPLFLLLTIFGCLLLSFTFSLYLFPCLLACSHWLFLSCVFLPSHNSFNVPFHYSFPFVFFALLFWFFLLTMWYLPLFFLESLLHLIYFQFSLSMYFCLLFFYESIDCFTPLSFYLYLLKGIFLAFNIFCSIYVETLKCSL